MLYVPCKVIQGIMSISTFVAEQEWAVINLTALPVFLIVAVYITMFITSHFLNIKFKHKLCFGALFMIFSCIITFGITIPVNKTLSISVINSYETSTYVLEFNGDKYCVGNFDLYSRKLTREYFASTVYSASEGLFFLEDKMPYDETIFKNAYYADVVGASDCLSFNESYSFDNVSVTAKSIDNTLCGYLFKNSNISIFVCNENAKYEHVASVINDNFGINILICNNNIAENYKNSSANFFVGYIISDGKTIFNSGEFYENLSGNWTLTFDNSKINLRSID